MGVCICVESEDKPLIAADDHGSDADWGDVELLLLKLFPYEIISFIFETRLLLFLLLFIINDDADVDVDVEDCGKWVYCCW